MPFPFYWVGALTAAAFLSIVLVIFGILLKIMNRAVTDVRESILSGIVVGIHSWDRHAGPRPIQAAPPGPDEGGSAIEEMPASARFSVERVRRAP